GDSAIRYGGTLTLPDGKGEFPAVILLTGSGAQDRDETIFYHKPFFVIADYLTKRGFAVLRLDDRGVGGTTGGDLPNTTDDFASDALEAVSFLKKQRNIDVSSIGLLVHSEGGAIAFIAANRSSEISFIVSLASPGMYGKKIDLEQLGQGLLNKETDTITVNNVLKFWDRSFDIITEARSGAGSVKFQITNVFKEWLMEFTDSPRSITLMGFDPAKLDDDTLVDGFLKSKMMVYLNPWYRY